MSNALLTKSAGNPDFLIKFKKYAPLFGEMRQFPKPVTNIVPALKVQQSFLMHEFVVFNGINMDKIHTVWIRERKIAGDIVKITMNMNLNVIENMGHLRYFQ